MTGTSPKLPQNALACARAIAQGATTSTAVTQAALAEIALCDAGIGAFVHVDNAGALLRAAAIDADVAAGKALGPLGGVPLSLKDNLSCIDMPLTAASKILRGYVPPFDATVVERLKAAGAVILGKTNLDEFAMGSSTENSSTQTTHNPWNLQLVPGGSSGGSAAAVAAGLGFASLGSDTGGSIRQPAALCGVVGLKPTYGRVSRYGAVAFASSLDQIGPIARTVPDAALLLQIIGGPDSRDATCHRQPQPEYLANLTNDIKGLRIGVPSEYFDVAGLDRGIGKRIEQALEIYRELGAQIVPIALPHTRHCIAAYYVIATAEASANLARYDGVRYGQRAAMQPSNTIDDLYATTRGEGFGTEVKRRILLGTYVLSAGFYDAYYRKACQARRLIHADFTNAFEKCDAIISPTSPVTAWPIGQMTQDPLAMYLMDIFTISANLAGLPAISVPTPPHPDSGLPVGLQLMAKPFAEAMLLQLAHAYMQATAPEQVQLWPSEKEA